MITTYVATVSPFGTAATDDSAPLARVRYINEHATYVAVNYFRHEALPSVTGYPLDYWLTIDSLARRAHEHIVELIASSQIEPVTTFQELRPDVAQRITDSPKVARMSALDRAYLQLRITDLLRFG